jgi:hypothetical protein
VKPAPFSAIRPGDGRVACTMLAVSDCWHYKPGDAVVDDTGALLRVDEIDLNVGVVWLRPFRWYERVVLWLRTTWRRIWRRP